MNFTLLLSRWKYSLSDSQAKKSILKSMKQLYAIPIFCNNYCTLQIINMPFDARSFISAAKIDDYRDKYSQWSHEQRS